MSSRHLHEVPLPTASTPIGSELLQRGNYMNSADNRNCFNVETIWIQRTVLWTEETWHNHSTEFPLIQIRTWMIMLIVRDTVNWIFLKWVVTHVSIIPGERVLILIDRRLTFPMISKTVKLWTNSRIIVFLKKYWQDHAEWIHWNILIDQHPLATTMGGMYTIATAILLWVM